MPRAARVWTGLLVGAALVAGGAEGLRERALAARLLAGLPDGVPTDPVLGPFARSLGATAYAAHCTGCHGANGEGDSRRGVPALAAGRWLYGSGRIAELEHTILYGIRSGHPKSWNLASMPAFATPRPYEAYAIDPLSPREIQDVALYVLALRHPAGDPAAVARGARVFHGKAGCFDCHGNDAKGDPAIGAPDLTDDQWLLGDGSAVSVGATIAHGSSGRCPAWIDRLPPATIRALAVYLQGLARVRP